MSYSGTDYEKPFAHLYVACWVIAVGAMVYLATRPDKPLPPNAKAYGCYTSDVAPPIKLDANGMQVFQPGVPRFGFHLEPQKTGMALTTERPLAAKPVGDRYAYYFYSPGEGTFLTFYNMQEGRRYGEFDEDSLFRFAMVARDGAELSYTKASSGDACR